MKRLAWMILGVLLCLGALLLPVWATNAASPAAQEAELPAFSPYEPPQDAAEGDAVFDAWERSLPGSYYRWTRGAIRGGGRPRFSPAFRAFYRDDPLVVIDRHIVYLKKQPVDGKGRPDGEPFLAVLDYFDSDEAEFGAESLRIPAQAEGLAVRDLYMYDDGWESVGDNGYCNETVRSIVIEAPLVRLSDYAFSNFTTLKKVVLPASVTAIGKGAFQNCKWLKSVKGCGAVTRIDDAAFDGCVNLDFRVPATVQRIGSRAFRNSGIRKAVLPVNTAFLDDEAETSQSVFLGCWRLRTVRFVGVDRDDWFFVPCQMFADCQALQTVTLPESRNIWLDIRAFANCQALQTVRGMTHVKEIKDEAFLHCVSLQTMTLPAGLQCVFWDAFLACSNLKSLTLCGKDPALFADKDGDKDCNFIKMLPKGCTVFVKTKEMKDTVLTLALRGTVKIRIKVAAPKTATAKKTGGRVVLQWSRVKNADGCRVWACDPQTGKLTKLATVKAPQRSVTVDSDAAQFVVRAYRVVDGDISWSAATVCG